MNAIHIVAAYESLRAEYSEYAAESRACGYEVESFERWAGMTSARSEAESRMIDIDSQYYHAD